MKLNSDKFSFQLTFQQLIQSNRTVSSLVCAYTRMYIRMHNGVPYISLAIDGQNEKPLIY